MAHVTSSGFRLSCALLWISGEWYVSTSLQRCLLYTWQLKPMLDTENIELSKGTRLPTAEGLRDRSPTVLMRKPNGVSMRLCFWKTLNPTFYISSPPGWVSEEWIITRFLETAGPVAMNDFMCEARNGYSLVFFRCWGERWRWQLGTWAPILRTKRWEKTTFFPQNTTDCAAETVVKKGWLLLSRMFIAWSTNV